MCVLRDGLFVNEIVLIESRQYMRMRVRLMSLNPRKPVRTILGVDNDKCRRFLAQVSQSAVVQNLPIETETKCQFTASDNKIPGLSVCSQKSHRFLELRDVSTMNPNQNKSCVDNSDKDHGSARSQLPESSSGEKPAESDR